MGAPAMDALPAQERSMNHEEHAAIIETIASDVLPKLVEILQEILPEYRERTVAAAMTLVGDLPVTVGGGQCKP